LSAALVLLFLFCVGSIIGWCIELIFRRFFSPNGRKTKKWVNPGFLTGPWLPLYGSGLTVLYLLAHFEVPGLSDHPIIEKIVLFALMACAMTLIEYVTGLIFIKGMHVMLWDYSNNKGNIQGIICPLFSFFWAVLSAVYYLLIHPYVLDALRWLSQNLAFSFFIGLFYGIFIMDCVYSFNMVAKFKHLADEYEVVLKYNELKDKLAEVREEAKEKGSFLFAFAAPGTKPMREIFEEYRERFSVSRITQNLKDDAAAIRTNVMEDAETLRKNLKEGSELRRSENKDSNKDSKV